MYSVLGTVTREGREGGEGEEEEAARGGERDFIFGWWLGRCCPSMSSIKAVINLYMSPVTKL